MQKRHHHTHLDRHFRLAGFKALSSATATAIPGLPILAEIANPQSFFPGCVASFARFVQCLRAHLQDEHRPPSLWHGSSARRPGLGSPAGKSNPSESRPRKGPFRLASFRWFAFLVYDRQVSELPQGEHEQGPARFRLGLRRNPLNAIVIGRINMSVSRRRRASGGTAGAASARWNAIIRVRRRSGRWA